MEALYNALLGELASRAVSFLASRFQAAAGGEEEDNLRRLRLLLLRSATVVQEADSRGVANPAALRQLRALRDETLRAHYVLDAMSYRGEQGGAAPSRFNPAKRVRLLFAGDNSRAEELQRMVGGLEAVLGDTKELVLFLARCTPVHRQPYSAHLLVDRCMFGRHAERDQLLEFLLQMASDDDGDPGVLAIVGPALIGKSTLVEHVCSDGRVRSHFSSIMFYTGGDGDGDVVLQDQTMADTCFFKDKCVIRHHEETTTEERWLLVIELSGDVDDEAWKRLYSRGRRRMPRGSKMILTSRSEKIARLGTTTARPLRLRCLPPEVMWYFFKLRVFGSADPDEHPKLASMAMEMALEARGSFVTTNIMAELLRGDLRSQLWSKVLTAARQYMRGNTVLFGEYPDDLKSKDRPRRTWSMDRLKPDDYFLMYDTYQKNNYRSRDQGEVVLPEITIMGMLSGRAQPRGRFEILFWKSVIPPYFSYVCPCDTRHL